MTAIGWSLNVHAAPNTGKSGASRSSTASTLHVEAPEIATLSNRTLQGVAVQATRRLVELGIEPHRMAIHVGWVDRDRFVYGVWIRLRTPVLTLEGEFGAAGHQVLECVDCSEDAIANAILEAVNRVLDEYRSARSAAEQRVADAQTKRREEADVQRKLNDAAAIDDSHPAEPSPRTEAAVVDSPPPPTGGRSVSSKPRRGLQIAGYSTLAVGVAAAVTGTVFAALGERRGEGMVVNGEVKVPVTDYGPAGYALIGAGGAAIVAGVTMAIVASVPSRSRSQAFRVSSRIRWTRGFGIQGRF